MVSACLVAMLFTLGPQRPVLAGYLPAWKTKEFDYARLQPFTDVIYFSVQPTADGGLDLKDIDVGDFAKLNRVKKKYGLRVLLCCGGWGRSDGFMAMASDPAKRQRFVEEANALCDKYGLDGLDLDWEHPKTPAEATAYGDLIQALRTAFRPKGRVVTAAIASWQSMSIEAVSGLDRVHLMSYDHQGRHATMDHAREDVRKLVAMGFPAKKIVLGVPFYGRNLAKWDDAKSYAEILTAFKPSPGDDEAGGYYFNGRKTLQEKAAFAKEKGLGGVMAWEVTHDASGRASLAGALRQALDKR